MLEIYKLTIQKHLSLLKKLNERIRESSKKLNSEISDCENLFSSDKIKNSARNKHLGIQTLSQKTKDEFVKSSHQNKF